MARKVETYESYRYLKQECANKLKRERDRIRYLQKLQRGVQRWIKRSRIRFVEVHFPEPNSSGYRSATIDIHSSEEAFIIVHDGSTHNVLASVFEHDFAALTNFGRADALYYACHGLLELKSARKLKRQTATEHLRTCTARFSTHELVKAHLSA